MKKFYFLLIALFLANAASAKGGSSCLPEGITFTTQAQIDSFQINYPGCTEIEDYLQIGHWGSSITNLNGLSVLNTIRGNFTITDNPDLANMTGLENVTSIGGDLRKKNGKECPGGVYVYKIIFSIDGVPGNQERIGTVMLLR